MSILDDYISALNEEQKEAVMHTGSPLLILAGAGSGKTRVITTKIAYLISHENVAPQSILAVTFTKKAATEMQERAILLEQRASNAQIRTFHSFGAWFLRLYSDVAGVDKNFTVYDDDDMETLLGKAVPNLTRQQISKYAHKISLAKDYCLTPDSLELGTIDSDPYFPSIYQAYENRKKQTGNVDFGDLILLPLLIMQDNEQIRQRIHYRFRVVMVDEYQDSNVAQFKLLKVLSGVEDNSGVYVCVVGDDDQSIYKFRGAEVQNILTFQQTFPGTQLIRLEKNYRSTSQILHAADSVIKNNESRLGKTLVAERGNGAKPTLVFLPNQDAETSFCGELIRDFREKGVPYSDWAILYRTNAQSLGFETEFLKKNIPYKVVGSLKFYEREEVKDALALLSLVSNPRDEVSFRRVINKPVRGIGPTSQDKIVEYAMSHTTDLLSVSGLKLSKKAKDSYDSFSSILKELANQLDEVASVNEKLSIFIERLLSRTSILEYHTTQDEISGSQKVANLQELVNSAVEYPLSREGLTDFLDNVELNRNLESKSENATEDGVTLITIHNTKGLEFSRVIITGMETGIFPREDKSGEDLEEERRLFYVGITRAKDMLYFTSCAMRRLYGRTNMMQCSLFLNELDKDKLKVLGDVPYSFGHAKNSKIPDEISKYCKGAAVYHDDYGYGIIENAYEQNDEWVISVQFESSGKKRFIPKYQKNKLLLAD